MAGNVRKAAEALHADREALPNLVLELPAVQEGDALVAVAAERLLQERIENERGITCAQSNHGPKVTALVASSSMPTVMPVNQP